LVQVIDDAQLFDRPSQLVVAHLAHHGAAFGLRSVFTVDEAADPSPFVALDRLRLQALTAVEVRRLLEQSAGRPLPHRVATLVQRWSGGNPSLALDLAQGLTGTELAGTSPIGLPLVPSEDAVEHLGDDVRRLPPEEVRVLAFFAHRQSLPVDVLVAAADSAARSGSFVVDGLVSRGWLVVHHRTTGPRRRGDALLAWAGLAPSQQQQLTLTLADQLSESAPDVSHYLAAHAGDTDALDGLVDQSARLISVGENELAAAAFRLALTRDAASGTEPSLPLLQLLLAEGYVVAASELLKRSEGSGSLPRVPLLHLLADLAALTSDPREATAHAGVDSPPTEALDDWLAAVLLICRVQLAVDGPDQSAVLVRALEPVLDRASVECAALARVVTAERAVYAEQPGSPVELRAALEAWMTQRPRKFDLSTMSAVVDLLGLGLLGEACDLLATAGSLQQLPFATARTALLTLRVEIEVAAGHYRRAAASLVDLDRQRPSVTGADLVTTTQAVRISTVCDDVEECRVIEARIELSPSAVLTYPARRAHTAALGFRELVLGNFAHSRDLLTTALQGPALLLQGRSCVLADLVEALVALGDRDLAAASLERFSAWLPDRDGDRTAGLLGRCQAMVAPDDEVDEQFELALESVPVAHEVDRGRTLLAYGRTLVMLDRPADASTVLTQALALFEASQLPGWERHVRRLLESCGPQPEVLDVPEVALTEIEEQVLALVLERRRNREIAASLFVSLRTVESHLTRIFRKVGVSTKRELYQRMADQ
jgi:DNA-binding CsgD family transcriptional regulator